MSQSNEYALLARIVGSSRSVLDCGCGHGGIARLLAAQGCAVIGIEADPERASVARDACELVIVADLESDAAFEAARLARPRYDAIVCSHVLEHLRRPEILLNRLSTLLAPGGHLIVGLPNVAHWRVRFQLGRGHWDYADYGIMDRTHLRYFTLATATALLRDAHFDVDEVLTPDFSGPSALHDAMRATLRLFTSRGFFASSFLFRCSTRPNGQNDGKHR